MFQNIHRCFTRRGFLLFYLLQISARFRNTRHVCADNAPTNHYGDSSKSGKLYSSLVTEVSMSAAKVVAIFAASLARTRISNTDWLPVILSLKLNIADWNSG